MHRTYAEGEVVFELGDVGEEFFIIAQGEVRRDS